MLSDPLVAVSGALRMVRGAEAELRAAVESARSAGHTWQEIGDLLGTSRQAAFQRFGRALDPRTGTPLGEPALPDAARRAEDLVIAVIECRWNDVRRDFDERMLEAVDEDLIELAWTQTASQVGRYERMGEPVVVATTDYTTVDVPLYFEAGERNVQVTYRAGGQVAGLWIRPVDR
ncbi:DUF3887 domain-containing protein [Actinophytocola sp.]|uniref:DUF3887 domain-containing protein n=1 Tax=Actinophytocola sp. TaxID=1872138 RepID=UPI002D7E556E|nr:DUF3887 domain-containing protein [Actinophytocola sp.]HET9140758.1 DUF3887 domain-containing protein [Actinophytocola sp.]